MEAQRAILRFAAMLALAVALGLLNGCARSESTAHAVADQAARSQALIESGNEAYRKGDFRLAARRYAAAAVIKKDDPAAYFGMGMALAKLGRDEEARSAYAHARELARKH